MSRHSDNGGMLLLADPLEVRHIDVVAVTPDRDANWSRRSTLPGEVIGTWSGENVRVPLGLVASLPESEQMRCFTPRYGMRLRTELIVLAEVALCFTCHNALVLSSEHPPQLPKWFTFDPDSAPAQQLLRSFREFAARRTDSTP